MYWATSASITATLKPRSFWEIKPSTGVGGGVCQVSTALFRTVFFGGYPINERHAHAYRVRYYEQTASGHNTDLAGLDATVFVPLVDFKFTNDSTSWLLMETYVNPTNYTLTWKFYSTSDGRTVDWQTTGLTNLVEPPDPTYRENPDLPTGKIKQVDWEVQGADVEVTRDVMRNGEILITTNLPPITRHGVTFTNTAPVPNCPTSSPRSKPARIDLRIVVKLGKNSSKLEPSW